MEQIKKLFTEEKGQGMTEYGLVLGLIAVAGVTAIAFLGDGLKEKFETLKGTILGANTPAQ